MSRSLVALIIVLLVLAGGLFYFASRPTGKEPARVEKVVPLENLAR